MGQKNVFQSFCEMILLLPRTMHSFRTQIVYLNESKSDNTMRFGII